MFQVHPLNNLYYKQNIDEQLFLDFFTIQDYVHKKEIIQNPNKIPPTN